MVTGKMGGAPFLHNGLLEGHVQPSILLRLAVRNPNSGLSTIAHPLVRKTSDERSG